MKFVPLFFDLISEFLLCSTKCQDLGHMVRAIQTYLKINNLCGDMAGDGSAFSFFLFRIDSEGVSVVRS